MSFHSFSGIQDTSKKSKTIAMAEICGFIECEVGRKYR